MDSREGLEDCNKMTTKLILTSRTQAPVKKADFSFFLFLVSDLAQRTYTLYPIYIILVKDDMSICMIYRII